MGDLVFVYIQVLIQNINFTKKFKSAITSYISKYL